MIVKIRKSVPVIVLTLCLVSSSLAANEDEPQKGDSNEANANTLQPVRVIDTGASYGTAVATPDGRTVVYFERYLTADLGLVLAEWSPWVVTGLAGLWLLWRWFRLIRLARRQPAKGEPYCRKCAYQLTGIDSKRCPECGRNITGRGRRVSIGGGKVFRKAMITLLLVGLVAGASHYFREELAGVVDRFVFWPAPAWLNEEADIHDGPRTLFTNFDPHWLNQHAIYTTKVRAYDIATGGVLWQRHVEDYWLTPRMAPSGQWVYVEGYVSGADNTFVSRIAVEDGRSESLFEVDANTEFNLLSAVTAQRIVVMRGHDVNVYDAEVREERQLDTFGKIPIPRPWTNSFREGDPQYLLAPALYYHLNTLVRIDFEHQLLHKAVGAYDNVSILGLSETGTVLYTESELDESRLDGHVHCLGVFGGKPRKPIPVEPTVEERQTVGGLVYPEIVITDKTGRYAFVFMTSGGYISDNVFEVETDWGVKIWDHREERMVAKINIGHGILGHRCISDDGSTFIAEIHRFSPKHDLIKVFDLREVLADLDE